MRACFLALALFGAFAAHAGEQAFDITLESGERQRILYDSPAMPRATLVMLPGGAGDIGIDAEGDPRHGENFVIRTQAQWIAKGYAVLIPDTIARESLRGQRSSPDYAAVVASLVRAAQAKASVPVFLLGTSQGSIAAANGAAHAAPGSVAGVILTEAVSRLGGSHETVFDADLGAIRVPALVVANRDDGCKVAPPEDAPRIVAALSRSPDARLLPVSGGRRGSGNPCASLSPHGYYGIEDRVVDGIADWLLIETNRPRQ